MQENETQKNQVQGTRTIYVPPKTTIPITDSHCHLSLIMREVPEFLDLLAQEQRFQDIMILDIGIDPSDFEDRIALTRQLSSTYLAVGMHPCQSQNYTIDTLIEELEPRIPQAVGVGEIGLDWYRMYAPQKIQTELFLAQIKLAKAYNKPIIIHARESLDDIITILKKEKLQRTAGNGIMHCFSGNAEQALRCLELGFFISYAGNISYASAEDVRTSVSVVPDEFLLAETDSPFLLSKGIQKLMKKAKKQYNKRYSKANTPLYLPCIYSILGQLKNCSETHIASLVRDNLRRVLGIYSTSLNPITIHH